MAPLEEICSDQRHAKLYSYLAKRAQPLLAAGEDVVFRLTYLVLRLEQVMGNVLILCDKATCDFGLSPICMFVLDRS